jgi:hypothetical protein
MRRFEDSIATTVNVEQVTENMVSGTTRFGQDCMCNVYLIYSKETGLGKS